MMLYSILSCGKHSMKTITNQNNVRLISNVPFRENFNLYEYKDNFLIRKFNELNEWYAKFTGLDEVKRLQDKVIVTQERLERAQEERREIGKLIVNIRKQSLDIQEQLHQVKKWDNIERFLQLTKAETELIKEERDLTAKFEVFDKAERELFTTLSNTVRDSHEKEKSQSEYTKYWGIILSIVGTIVGAVISTIISTIRNRQIVLGINKSVEEKFDKITSMYKSNDNFENLRKENHDISKLILGNLSENIKETKKLKKENYDYSKQIMNQLRENNNIMNAILESTNNRLLLSLDDIKETDKFINVGNYVQAQNNLMQQAKRVVVWGVLGIVVLSLLCVR